MAQVLELGVQFKIEVLEREIHPFKPLIVAASPKIKVRDYSALVPNAGGNGA